MIRALRESGWCNYSLFLRPDWLLVGYLETPNFEQALAEMKRRDVNERWQREMGRFSFRTMAADRWHIPIEGCLTCIQCSAKEIKILAVAGCQMCSVFIQA